MHRTCVIGGSGMRRVQSMKPMLATNVGVITGGIDGEESSPVKHMKLDSFEE